MYISLFQALLTISTLPFHLANDLWKWKVFRNEVDPDQWNKLFWELTNEYAGFESPLNRTNEDFDSHAIFDVGEDWDMMRYES